MKVCFWGNQDNMAYRLCTWLREKGVDAHLYMMEGDNIRSFPESIDRNLSRESYPNWIHTYNNIRHRSIFVDSQVKAWIDSYFDIIVVSGASAMMNARCFDLPMINLSTGPSNQGVISLWSHYNLIQRVKHSLGRFLIRQSVRHCQKILVHYDPELYSLARIGQEGKAIFFGFPEDVSGNLARVDTDLLAKLNAVYKGYDKIFMWLSRVSFSDPISPMYKGTDKFVKAAKSVIDEGANIKLIIINHGEDIDKLRMLVSELGISQYVEWVPHMEFWKLLTYISVSNAVVFDELTEFNCISSGVFRECLSVGGVLVRSFSQVLTNIGYGPDCPVLHAVTVEDVRRQMRKVMSWNEEDMLKRREKNLKWAYKHLHWENQINKLVNILEQTLYINRVYSRISKLYAGKD